MKKKKITFLLITIFTLMLILSGCGLSDLLKKKVVNEIENRYIDYQSNITVNDIEDALTTASEIGKSSSVGVRMASNGVFTTTIDTGSGVIVKRVDEGSSGYQYYVVTNRHVVYSTKMGNKQIKVYLGPDKGYTDASLVQYDTKVDLALLSFHSPYLLNVATINTTTPKVGAFAIAIGSPYDLEAYFNTVTVGSISSSKRLYIEEDVSGREVNNEYLQHCAAINSGNSGGGLFNIYGELIGINTWKVVGELSDNIEGLCFSIPSSVVVNTFKKYLG